MAIRTPHVLRATRAHFDCPSLQGAQLWRGLQLYVYRLQPHASRLQPYVYRLQPYYFPGAQLEDGGVAGTAGCHWEMRWFRDEYMTGSASPSDRVLSAVSLALFADSGWYEVDGAGAEPMAWS